jgi:hypothetical protein
LFNYKLIADRTVIGACLLDATYQVSYYCWANYFTSFLQAVNDLTLAESGYVGNTFDVVSGLLLLGVGFLIRRIGRFKWLLYIAVPLYILAQGLMIYFRRPNQSVLIVQTKNSKRLQYIIRRFLFSTGNFQNNS